MLSDPLLQLRLDGTIEVMLPNGTSVVVPLDRLTRLYDSAEQLEDLWAEEGGSVGEGSDVEVWEMDQDGHWVEGRDDEEWESADEDVDDEMVDASEGDDGEWTPFNNIAAVPQPRPPSPMPMVVDDAPSMVSAASAADPPHPSDVPKDATKDDEDDDEEEDGKPWKRFEILPSAPVDHAYYSTAPAQPSRSFMSRLTKEYKALQSSLPGAPSCLPIRKLARR